MIIKKDCLQVVSKSMNFGEKNSLQNPVRILYKVVLENI